MGNDVRPFDERNLRGMDRNSLLRLYDLANETFRSSLLQQERERADKAIQRITKELQKRGLPL